MPTIQALVRSVGAASPGLTAATTVAAPAGVHVGDLEILVATTIAGGTVTISNNGGGAWTAHANSPIDVTAGEKLYVWYRIRAAGDTNPQVTAGTDHVQACRISIFKGTFDTTTPLEAMASGSEATSDTSFSFAPGVSTTVDSAICFVVCSSGVDIATPQGGTNTANASLTGVTATPIANFETANGAGGGFFVATGVLAVAGSTGTWTNTMVSATPKAYLAFAVRHATVATGYLDVPLNGSCTTPDVSALNTGAAQIDLRSLIDPQTWTVVTEQFILAQYDQTNNSRWLLDLYGDGSSNGFLSGAYVDNTLQSENQEFSTNPLSTFGFVDGTPMWIRVLLDPAAATVSLFTSPDGTTWTGRGSHSTFVAGINTLGTRPVVAVGSDSIGGAGHNPYVGHILRSVVIVGGTTVFDMDWTAANPGTGTWTSGTGEVWTRRGTAQVIGGTVPGGITNFAPQALQDTSQAWDKPRRYDAGRSRTFGNFTPNPIVPDTASLGAQSRRVENYIGSKDVNSNTFDPLTNKFADWVAQPVTERQVPFYLPPRSLVLPIAWGQSIVTDQPAPVIVSRAVPFYRAPAAVTIPVYDPATNTYRDWTPAPVLSRAVPLYSARSTVVPVYDQPTTVFGTDWSAVVASSLSPFYRSPLSQGADVYFSAPVTPDQAVLIAQSRAVPDYVGGRSLTIPVWDPATATFSDWTPGVIASRIGALRQVGSFVVTPGVSAAPDSFAPGIVQRAALRAPWIGVQPVVAWGQSVVTDAIAIVAQSQRGLGAPQRPSQALGLWTPTITPDALAPVAQSPAARVTRPVGSSVSSDFAAAAPAQQGYVAVARSAPSMRALVRQSLTITPDFGLLVVTLPPAGGGGEWVIWEKPNFPANRRDAWPSFVPPYFRKPSRPVKRGY